MTDDRRFMLLRVSPNFLLELLREGANGSLRVLRNGVPTDAYIVSAHYDHEHDLLCLRLHSISFDPVPEGCVLPWLPEPVIEFARVAE